MPPQDLYREDCRLGPWARAGWLAGIGLAVVLASRVRYESATHGVEVGVPIVAWATLVLLPLACFLATSSHTVRITAAGVEVVWGRLGWPRWRIPAEAIEWFRPTQRDAALSRMLADPAYKALWPLSLTAGELAGCVEIKRRDSRRLYLVSTSSPQRLAAAIEAATGLPPGCGAAYSEDEGGPPRRSAGSAVSNGAYPRPAASRPSG